MRVSIVIPTYNSARFIETAIKSVLAQTYKDYEVIVVDDGSSDNTNEVVKKFKSACTYLRQTNAGPSAARNYGTSQSSGDLIAFLDADDAWLPGKLEAQVGLLSQRPEVGLIETGYYLCDADLRPIRYQPPVNLRGNALEDMLVNFKTPLTSSIVVRRYLLKQVGGFDVSLHILEDHELCLRLIQHCVFDCLDEPYVYYRVHPASSLTNGRMILDTHMKIIDQTVASSTTLAHKQLVARRHVETFAIKTMCLQHQWRDAWPTIVHFWRSYPLQYACRVSFYLVLLAVPKSFVPYVRKLYWKLCPAESS